MRKLIFCTVGTSVFDPKRHDAWYGPRLAEFYGHISSGGNSYKIEEFCKNHGIRDTIIDFFSTKLRKDIKDPESFMPSDFSAELGSMAEMTWSKNEQKEVVVGPFSAEDKVVLLYSETPEGRLAAEINGAVIAEVFFSNGCNLDSPVSKTWLNMKTFDQERKAVAEDGIIRKTVVSPNVELIELTGLSATNTETIKRGLKHLIGLIDTSDAYRCQTKIFNFTGGYKGIVPIAAVSAWNRRFSLCYLHENGEDLVFFKSIDGFMLGKDDAPYRLLEGISVWDPRGNLRILVESWEKEKGLRKGR